MGSDAGDISQRKHHESIAFRDENRNLLQRWGDPDGKSEQSVRRAIEDLRSASHCEELASTIDISRVCRAYPVQTGVRWGWKDPRNSITFPVWKIKFPHAKAVIITKGNDGRMARSKSGLWFKVEAGDWIKDAYMNPGWSARYKDVIQVSFEAITTDSGEFNRLLDFCGLELKSSAEFARLLAEAAYETK